MLLAAVACVVGGLLLIAGVPKIRDRDAFVAVVENYRLLPRPLAQFVGRTLPVVEVVLGVGLVAGIFPRWVGLVAAAVFVSFFVGLTVNLVRGHTNLDCGCFAFTAHSDESAKITWLHAARALVLVALSVLAMFAPSTFTWDRLAGIAIGALIVALGGVVAFALTVISPGRRPVDSYLTPQSIAERSLSTRSRV